MDGLFGDGAVTMLAPYIRTEHVDLVCVQRDQLDSGDHFCEWKMGVNRCESYLCVCLDAECSQYRDDYVRFHVLWFCEGKAIGNDMKMPI